MNALFLDLKQALRGLRRSPAFASMSVATLALGIGVSTTLFTAVYGVFLKPLPYRQADRLVAVTRFSPNGPLPLSAPQYYDLRSDARTLDGMAIQRRCSFEYANLTRPERIDAMEVSTDYFALLGYLPTAGRFFLPEDEEESHAVVVLSHGFWMRVLGGDPAVVGKSLPLDGRARTIVGIAPEMELPRNYGAQVFVPIDRRGPIASNRADHEYLGIGRLKPRIDVAVAGDELLALFRASVERYPGVVDPDFPFALRPLQPFLIGDRSWTATILAISVVSLLLISCINVASLFLARALSRARETAVRVSLGAGSARLFRTYLTEGLLVGFAGCLMGVAIARLAVRSIPLWFPSAAILNGINRLSLDPAVAVFALALSLTASVLFALAPLLQTQRLDIQCSLREGGRGGSAAHGRLRAWLVVGEVALTTVLLVSSGLLLRSLSKVLATHPGFDLSHLVSFTVNLPPTRYPTEPDQTRFHDELVRRLRTVPSVESVGSSAQSPLFGPEGDASFFVGDPADYPRQAPSATHDTVGADYFVTMRIPVLRGRALGEGDTARADRVAVVNETLAKRFIKGDPIGQRIVLGWDTQTSPSRTPFEIVGVVADIRNESLDVPPTPRVIAPSAQVPWPSMSFILRSSHSPEAIRSLIDEKVAQVDPALPLLRYEGLEARAARRTGDRTQTLWLLGTFSILGLVLSAIGIYGVVSYLVAQRTREFGIRRALGAQVTDVLGLVLGQGNRMVVGGVALGLIGAFAAGRLLSSQLYGVTGFDPAAISASVLVLVGTGLMACLVPALRAASVDPAVVLREE